MASIDRRIVFRAALAVALMSAVTLSACGRKGPLEPPPSAKVTNPDGETVDTPPEKPDKPFFLDFLI